jgi:hypothetical protein
VARGLARLTSGPLRWARRQGVFRSAGVVALIVLFLGWWRWDNIGKALIPAVVFFFLAWLAISRGPVRGLIVRQMRRKP